MLSVYEGAATEGGRLVMRMSGCWVEDELQGEGLLETLNSTENEDAEDDESSASFVGALDADEAEESEEAEDEDQKGGKFMKLATKTAVQLGMREEVRMNVIRDYNNDCK